MKSSSSSYDPKTDIEFKRLLDRANAYWDEKSLEKALEEYLRLLKLALTLQKIENETERLIDHFSKTCLNGISFELIPSLLFGEI